MLKDWFSKIGCALKSVMGNIRIEKKITNIATSDAGLFEEENIEQTSVKKEPVEIKIHNTIYEYAHGKKFKNNPLWIVIHYTGCANVNAKSMCKAMKNNTSASSHFYIDEKDICQAVPLDYIAWHVSDGKCKQPNTYSKKSLDELCNYKAKDWRYDLAAKSHIKWINDGCDFNGNSVSISVDICVKKKNTKTIKATDEDWYFEDLAVDNAAKLVAYLANRYNIDSSHIITHCMATGKLCPQPFTWPPEEGDKNWAEFINKVNHYREYNINVNFV